MTKEKPTIGFKNEIVRTQAKVPDVIRNYPEKQFWKLSDAPFLSKSYLKLYVGYVTLIVASGGLVIWAKDRFNLFQSKIYTGDTKYESELLWDFPHLDDSKVYKTTTPFSERYKKREIERIEEIKKARLIREQELKSKLDEKNKNVNLKSENKTSTN